jgi:hypothetical protein
MELRTSSNRKDSAYGFGVPQRDSETNVELERVRIPSRDLNCHCFHFWSLDLQQRFTCRIKRMFSFWNMCSGPTTNIPFTNCISHRGIDKLVPFRSRTLCYSRYVLIEGIPSWYILARNTRE